MQLTDKQKGIGLALFGVLLITPDSLFVRLITVNSWELIFYRGLIPFVCLLITLLFFYKKNFIHACYITGFAGVLNAILMALGNITFVISLENTNVANTLIMLSLAPFMAAIMSSIFLREHPNKRTWITMTTCFVFILFIFYDSYEAKRIYGDLFGLATAIFIGASAVVIRYAKLVNFLPSLLLAKFFIILIAIFFVQSFHIEGSDIYFIIIMGIFCVFIPLSFITLAPRYIAAHEVELFFVLETALGPFWVWLVIHEQPSIKTIIGGVCIVILIFTHTFLEFKEKKFN